MKSNAFSQTIQSYLNYTQMPWGKLFYQTAWHQIDLHKKEPTNATVLDIGSGFGITSLHYAHKGNQVTGLEPTREMVQIAENAAAESETSITFINAPLEEAGTLLSDHYDWIICHNILEYVEPRPFIKTIGSLQLQNGFLSLICHNPAAKLMKKAVIGKNPEDALTSLHSNKEFSSIIQTDITTYDYETLCIWLEEEDYVIVERFGIHNLYGYIADNDIKHDENWHRQMLALELEISSLSPYREVAIFTHILARKKQ